ncbi:hypothetical protein D3C81_1724560 [compost metagenome]
MQRLGTWLGAHPHQLDAHRYMGDGWAGNFTHPGDLHAVAMQRRAVLRHDHHGHAPAAVLQGLDECIEVIQ